LQRVEPAKPLNEAQIGGSFYLLKMYSSDILQFQTIEEIILMLEKQGLLIDKTNARKQFQRIGYFRLRSYLYPLLDTPKSLGLFKPGATFEQAMELYKFDRKLRLLVFSQIEKIEIAVRCQLVTIGCKEIGAVDWLYQESNFSDNQQFVQTLAVLSSEWKHTKEDFAQEFQATYGKALPPVWMILELIPIGTLAHLYRNIKSKSLRKKISQYFGTPPDVFASWLFCFASIRNICCHHNRLWNRTLPNTPAILKRPKGNWISFNAIDYGRLYYKLAMIQYVLSFICPNHHFSSSLKQLGREYPRVDFSIMNFPEDWEEEPFWNNPN
jgi:hypothetical protein